MSISIAKAIETLILDGFQDPKDPFCDLENATKLGIEALKAITAIRYGDFSDVSQPLPGEEED